MTSTIINGTSFDRAALDSIALERAAQMHQWGGGSQEDCAEHDDQHWPVEWLREVAERAYGARLHALTEYVHLAHPAAILSLVARLRAAEARASNLRAALETIDMDHVGKSAGRTAAAALVVDDALRGAK